MSVSDFTGTYYRGFKPIDMKVQLTTIVEQTLSQYASQQQGYVVAADLDDYQDDAYSYDDDDL